MSVVQVPLLPEFTGAVATPCPKPAFRSASPHPLALTFFLPPVLQCSLGLGEVNINVLFRTDHSTVTYSQPLTS